MTAERAILEMNSRAIAIMQFYRNSDRRPSHKAEMIAEIQEVAAWYRDRGLNGSVLQTEVLEPIAAGLNERHGAIVGLRVYAEFLAAFDLINPDPTPFADSPLATSRSQ